MENKEKSYWVALSLILGLGPIHFKKLLAYFKSVRNIWEADDGEIKKIGLGEKLHRVFIESRKSIEPAAYFEHISNQKIRVITWDDKEYPPLLKEIYDPPFLLYVKGNLEFNHNLYLGVVGTRRITPYGVQAIEYLIGELVSYGLIIVSGLARGGDSIAHKTAIQRNGQTIAVLGSGVNYIYPPENKQLAEQITHHGALISEFPPHIKPERYFFPIRNRIISGLSLGVLVVEASEKSGTLITAKCALDQNREVFALPGSIFNPYSKGPAKLIKMGAKLVTGIDDIIEELNLEGRLQAQKAAEIIPASPEEERVLTSLQRGESISVDELIREVKMPVSELSALLTVMEMKGTIKSFGGGNYAIQKNKK